MQAVAELVEQRAHVVHGQQRGRPRRALGEVVVVQDHGDLGRAVLRGQSRTLRHVAVLPAQRAHPRAAALGGPGEVVLQEDAAHLTARVTHLVGLHIRVVDGQLRAMCELQAEQAPCAVEGGLHHAVQAEVGLDLGVVHRVARHAHLLGPDAPVPRLDHGIRALPGVHHGRTQHLPLTLHRGQGAGPHLVQQLPHRLLRAGHPVHQRVVGVAGMAVQPGLLAAQLQDGTRHLAVVMLARLFAAAGPGAPGLLTQVAPGREGQEGHDQRAAERDDMGLGVVLQAAVDGGLARGVAHKARQAGQLVLGAQHELVRGFVVQHVLAKEGGEARQFLHHGGVAGLVRTLQPRARADEVEVDALQQAQLLRRQAQRAAGLVQGVDAREERGVHVDAVGVRRQGAGHLALHRLQRRRGLGGGEVVEHRLDAAQQPARAVKRSHRVVKVRRRGLTRNGVKLVAVRLHRGLEGRRKVGRLELAERRQAVRRGPGLEQGIGGGGGGCFGHGQMMPLGLHRQGNMASQSAPAMALLAL